MSQRTLFYAPMEARGGMLAQGAQDVFVSDSDGDQGTFTRAQIPPPVGMAFDMVSALEIPSDDRILVGTALGGLFELTRTVAPAPPGWAVRALGASPFPGQYVTDLLTDPHDPRRIWVTFGGIVAGFIRPTDAARTAIALSVDGGTNFTPAIGGLPAGLRVWAIAADPANAPTVFAAADNGVYRSVDSGATWTTVGDGLPHTQVKDLLFHPHARVLRAGTKSRGVWELDVDLPPATGPEVYVRYHPVDTGRPLPGAALAPVETPDPFGPNGTARWWESPDVKVDAAPSLRAGLADVDVNVFSDDHGLAAAGLFAELPVPGETSRLYVQVHNRSHLDAVDVDVRVFFTPGAAVGAPPLPAGFWAGWPGNAPAATSAWQPAAATARLPRIEPGRGRLARFEWAVPADLPDGAALLAVAVPSGTAFAPAATTVSELLAATPAAALASVLPVRPGPGLPGPRPGAVQAVVHASSGAGAYRLEVNSGSSGIIAGAVLSTALSNLAGGAGAEPLTEVNHPELGALLASRPALGGRLDRTRLYRPPPRGAWLGPLTLAAGDAEPIVLLITRPQPPRGRWCLVQRDAAGTVRGGVTVLA